MWLEKWLTGGAQMAVISDAETNQRPVSSDKVLGDWKIGKIILIFKIAKKDDPGDYGPISLTSGYPPHPLCSGEASSGILHPDVEF